jgi:hypothetical protein
MTAPGGRNAEELRQSILKKRLRGDANAHLSSTARIASRGLSGPVALSFGQQRLWFVEQLEPGNVAYNMRVAVRLRGVLDVAVLQRCFDEVVARHEVLRTTFRVLDGQSVQDLGVSAGIDRRVSSSTAVASKSHVGCHGAVT